jgi:DNA-binding beta-propeller fold protein YncE
MSGSEHAMYLINLDQPGIRRVDHFVEGPCCPLPDPMSDTIFVAGLSRERDLVYMIDGATGAVRNQAKIGQLAIDLVIDPHLQLLFVVNNRTPSLPIITTTTGALLHTVGLPAIPYGLAVDMVAGQLFVSTPAGVTILRSTDGSLITQLNAEYIYGAPFGGLANSTSPEWI